LCRLPHVAFACYSAASLPLFHLLASRCPRSLQRACGPARQVVYLPFACTLWPTL
jgi:hypothetical protein